MVFDSTHAAIAAQRALEGLLPLRVVPTLRQIAASCGISLRVERAQGGALERALGRGVVPRSAYRLYEINGSELRTVEKGGM